MKLRRFALGAALLVTLLVLAVYVGAALPQKGRLIVHFLDVGQADSILVQAPGNEAILIDGGNNGDGQMVVDYLRRCGVTRLAAVVATHPHEDHIGGLVTVLRSIPVSKVYMPNAPTTTRTFEAFIEAVKESGARRIEVRPGVEMQIHGITARFLAPISSNYEDLNDYSAVLRVTHGKIAFLFTGDAEAKSEVEMLCSGADVSATVLKVAHHGSNSSTTDPFLKAVSPKYAVISVGKGNRYGHPSPEVLDRLRRAGVVIYRTDEHGTIVATSDGRMVESTTSKAAKELGYMPCGVCRLPTKWLYRKG